MKQTNCTYIDQLNRAEYAKSYKSLSDDSIIRIAEEGIDDYFEQLEEYPKAK